MRGDTSDHLDPDTAATYAAHALSEEAAARVDQHIDACSSCRELLSMIAKAGWSRTSSEDRLSPHAEGAVLPRGTPVGPFVIDQPLEAGGMGLVYSAHDERLGRRVALKCVRDPRGDSEQLRREAKLMAQLAHPNVVPVYDVLQAAGQVFIAMELVVGRSVRQWLDVQPRSWSEVVDVFLDAGAGLAAAHAAGIVHGDVKPANILVGDDGRARVTDFGLGSHTSEEPREVSDVRGTPAYLAPEQRAGRPCDARADQYSFCLGLFEALHGGLPGAPGLRAVRLPRALRTLLARGMALEPEARFASMTALLQRLRAIRSSRRVLALVGSGLTVLVVALAFYVGGRRVEVEQCAAAASELAQPWNDEARAGVRDAFTRSHLSYAAETLSRVEAKLDGWAHRFELARRSACEFGWFRREVPLERLGPQLTCLKDSGREVRALVSQLRGADATVVLNSIAAIEQLTPVERCVAAQPQRVPPPEGPQVSALRDGFAHAHALMDSGKFRDALPVSTEVLKQALALGDTGLIAAGRVSLGSNQARLADYDAAVTNLQEAIRLADATLDDRLRAQAWVSLVQSEYWRGHHQQVVFMKEPALGACERVGDVGLQTELMLMVGGSLSQLGKAADAQALFEEAVRLRVKVYGEHDRRVSFALSSLGNALSMQGDLAGGVDAHRRALSIAQAALGAAHPNVGILHDNLGDDHLYGLHAAEALAELQTGVGILEAANGPTNRDVAVGSTDLGLAYLEAGQPARALETFERAELLWSTLGPQHPVRAEALLGRHEALVALGRPAPVADLETALTLSGGLPPFERGRIQLALGLALTDPKAHQRAIELVTVARAGLKGSPLPLIQRELGRADEWLRAQGVTP